MGEMNIEDVRDRILTELYELAAKLRSVHKTANRLTIDDTEIPGIDFILKELIESTNMVKGLMESIEVALTPKPNRKQRKV